VTINFKTTKFWQFITLAAIYIKFLYCPYKCGKTLLSLTRKYVYKLAQNVFLISSANKKWKTVNVKPW